MRNTRLKTPPDFTIEDLKENLESSMALINFRLEEDSIKTELMDGLDYCLFLLGACELGDLSDYYKGERFHE